MSAVWAVVSAPFPMFLIGLIVATVVVTEWKERH